jgi:hypothetical protein
MKNIIKALTRYDSETNGVFGTKTTSTTALVTTVVVITKQQAKHMQITPQHSVLRVDAEHREIGG